MVGMKVNNIEVWDRVKAGELKGFSVESMISLEEFSKNENNMDIKTDEMFWDKLKNILKDTFSKKEEPVEIEPTNIDLEAEPQAEPQPTVEAPKVEEPKVEEPKVEEPVVEEPKQEESPKAEEAPKVEDNHLEELINSLKEEIAALKTSNGELQEKIKDMGKQPSAAPINTNAKPNAGDTYAAWREQMRAMIG
jgi:outer membrane biosynthesis protein TonB